MSVSGVDKKVLAKLERYCAWQERCMAEVKAKMIQLGVLPPHQEVILEYLVDQDYIHEQRFAQQYALGKFRLKKWGRIKINQALISKEISTQFIDNALAQFDKEAYQATLTELLKVKHQSLAMVDDPYVRNHKTSLYAVAKGYEPDLVWQQIKALYPIKS